MIQEEAKLVIAAIEPKMVEMIWPRIEPMIEAAIEHSNDEMKAEVTKEKAIAGTVLIMVIYEGDSIIATLTLDKRYFDSGKKILNITTAGGADLHLWMHEFLEIVDNIAIEYDCEEVYIVGRKGWQRILADQGFGVVHTVLSRKVER